MRSTHCSRYSVPHTGDYAEIKEYFDKKAGENPFIALIVNAFENREDRIPCKLYDDRNQILKSIFVSDFYKKIQKYFVIIS